MTADANQAIAEEMKNGGETSTTIDNILNGILDLKEQEAALGKEQKRLADVRKQLEKTGVEMMQAQGLERTGNEAANALIQHKKHPQVKDWDAFANYIYENKAAYLLQRRVSSKAVEEIVDSGDEVPGIEFYEEDRLMVRRR